MNNTFKKYFLIILQDLFLASFLFLLGSFFLEYFFPGIIAFFIRPFWIFLFTLFFGILIAFFPKEENPTPSEKTSRLSIVLYFLEVFFAMVVAFKMFSGLPVLQIIILFILFLLAWLLFRL